MDTSQVAFPSFPPAALLLLAASLTSLASAESFCGRVVDPSGAAVAGANISLHSRENPLRQATSSNAGGGFCFVDLPTGDYLAEAQAPGLGTSAAVAVGVPVAGGREIEMRLDIARLHTRVLVTASSSAQSTDEIAKALDVVDAGEIERRAEFSLPEAVRLVPGVRVQQGGGPGGLARILVRGMRAFDTSILVDGFRFRDASAPQGDATGFLTELQVFNVNRLEVLRGSGSSLYGSNATGGAIHLVTDQGGGATRGSIEAEGGGLGFARGVARLAGGSWNDRLQYSAGISHVNVTRGLDGDDRSRNSTGHGFGQLRLTPSTTLSARGLVNDGFVGLNDSPYAIASLNPPPAGPVPAVAPDPEQVRRIEAGLPFQPGAATFVPSLNDPDSRRTSRFSSGMTAFTQRLSPSASYRVAYQGLATRRDSRDGPAGVRFEPSFNTLDRFRSRIDTIEARTDLQLGRLQVVTAGYEFEREDYDIRAQDANPDAVQRVDARSRVAEQSHAVFAQDQIRLLGERLRISVSGRMQRFGLRGPEFAGGAPRYAGVRLEAPPNAYTGDGSIAYFIPSSGTKLRAHGGNGYRAPSLYERFGTAFFFGEFSALGDPRLRPERTIAVDAGFDQYFASSRLRLSGTYFYTRLQEVIFFDFSGAVNPATDPFGRFGGYSNTGGGLARGIEMSAEAAPIRSLRLKSSYTYTNARERLSSVLDGSLRSPRIPAHMFTATVTQQIRRRVDVTFDLMTASSYEFPFFAGAGARAFRFDGPLKADLVAGYTHTVTDRRALRFYGRVENLFNRRYYEDGFRTPGAWATAGLKLMF